MQEICRENFNKFIEVSAQETASLLEAMDYLEIEHAADLIISAKAKGNRLHISGIGKPSHIATYAASLLSSTGTPAYYLHGTEAVHGSCGQLVPGDVVIFISNSGETPEMRATVNAVKNNGCFIIGISGNPKSWLASESDIHLCAHVDWEGGPLNRAPRMSVIAELIVIQALSVVLQSAANITPAQYVKWHPGGTLGKLRSEEVDT